MHFAIDDFGFSEVSFAAVPFFDKSRFNYAGCEQFWPFKFAGNVNYRRAYGAIPVGG